MNNFTYRSAEEKQNLEAILKQRKRKLNMQQIISAVIFLVISAVIVLYFGFHVYYTEYDGYVHVDQNKVRTPFDIYLDSVYVNVGDIVAPGDTLYSYFMVDHLIENSNPNAEPTILTRNRDILMRHQTVSSEVAVLRVRITELKQQIAKEDHNVAFGLSSNSHKLDLMRELNEAQARLEALIRELALLNNLRRETNPQFTRRSGHGSRGQQIYDDSKSDLFPVGRSYHLASDSSIVTELMAPDRMIFFKQEEILTMQHMDLEGNNLHVVAYVPIDKMHRIHNHSEAEVVVNSDFSFLAHVTSLGLRTSQIPENLRSYFSKKNTALIAELKIDSGQTVPLWNTAAGLPVRVRVRNRDTWGREPTSQNYLWYTTGKGMQILPDSSYFTLAHSMSLVDTVSQVATRVIQRSDTTTASDGEGTDTLVAGMSTLNEPKTVSQRQAPGSLSSSEKSASSQPAAQPKSESVISGPYYVQVFNFRSEKKALQELRTLRKTLPEASLIRVGKTWRGVVAGCENQAQAQEVLNRVVKIDGCEEAWIFIDKNNSAEVVNTPSKHDN